MSYEPPMFRDRPCPHIFKYNTKTPNRREHFYDYGSPWSVDVVASAESSKVLFPLLRCLKCPNMKKTLTATQPTLPILPPNQYKHTNMEPCMQAHRHNINLCKNLLRSINTFTNACKKERLKTREIVMDKLKNIQELQEKMLTEGAEEETRGIYENECESGSDVVLQCLRRLAMAGRNVLFNPSALHLKFHNENYNGGCLSHVSSQSSPHPSHLIFPTGSLMNYIKVCQINEEEEEEDDGDNDSVYFKKGGEERGSGGLKLKSPHLLHHHSHPILQIDALHVQDAVLCAYRSSQGVYLLDLSTNLPINTTSSLPIPSSIPSSIPPSIPIYLSSPHKPTFLSLSPHIAGEMVYSNYNNQVFFNNKNNKSSQIHTSPVTHPISHLGFTNHSSIITITTPQRISLFDIRTPPLRATQIIVRTHTKNFFRSEVITSYHYPHHTPTTHNPLTPHHHFFATNTALCVMDDRMPMQLLLRWNHSMLTTPSLTTTISMGGEDVVAVATQEWPEVHAFQFHGGSGGKSGDLSCEDDVGKGGGRWGGGDIQACGSPWKISKPLDFLTLMSRQGNVSYDSNIEQRLNNPLIGLAMLPMSEGMSVLQLSSVGDLMCQDYKWSSDLREGDKTFSMGPGSEGLRMGGRGVLVGKRWLEDTYKTYYQADKEASGDRDRRDDGEGGEDGSVVRLKTGTVFSGNLSYLSTPSRFCAFCSPNTSKQRKDDHIIDVNEDGGDDEDDDGDISGDDDDKQEGSCDVCNSCGLSLTVSEKIMQFLIQDKLPSSGCDEGLISSQHDVRRLIGVDKDEYDDVDTKILISSFQNDDDLYDLVQKRSDLTKNEHDEILKMAEKKLKEENGDDDDDIVEGDGSGDDDDAVVNGDDGDSKDGDNDGGKKGDDNDGVVNGDDGDSKDSDNDVGKKGDDNDGVVNRDDNDADMNDDDNNADFLEKSYEEDEEDEPDKSQNKKIKLSYDWMD